MSNNDYNFDSFILPKWPKPFQEQDGWWKRIWSIELVDIPNDKTKVRELEEKLSNDEIKVSIHLNNNQASIEVNTLRWSLEDDLITYSYTILQKLNNDLVEIKTIQGQKRDDWHTRIWNKD